MQGSAYNKPEWSKKLRELKAYEQSVAGEQSLVGTSQRSALEGVRRRIAKMEYVLQNTTFPVNSFKTPVITYPDPYRRKRTLKTAPHLNITIASATR